MSRGDCLLLRQADLATRLATIDALDNLAWIKEKTGETAMDYLTRWRMVLAADRLANHGMTIAAVAPMVGYDSESAFGAAFRRVVGSSPRQFAISAAAKPS